MINICNYKNKKAHIGETESNLLIPICALQKGEKLMKKLYQMGITHLRIICLVQRFESVIYQ